MVTFTLSLIALIVGYVVYGRIVERIFGPDDRPTPAVSMADGVDYVALPGWKIFMIQFLNIAGTGPIFGAIMGAKFGPSAYLWIVLGCIFAGAVHDYLSGMLSMRHGGAGLPELVGSYLGKRTKRVMLVFSVFLLLMVGAVFVYSPALILGRICGGDSLTWIYAWCVIIFIYYFLAAMLPIDKIIGKIYPFFAICMLFMAVALMAVLFWRWPSLPELTDGLDNFTPSAGTIFPCLFITIACGAISGFHATQSPLMARCVKSERQGRPLFYGAMITEGIVALIWATVAMYFFYGGAAQELGVSLKLQAPEVVTTVSSGWLGTFGGILAILGVVAAPITSGDTALRSARLIIADFLHMEQHSLRRRMYICIPVFAFTLALLWFNIADEDGFNTIWSYFGWANQTLAVFTLWTLTVHLCRQGKCYWVTLLPAMFMTAVCSSFILVSKDSFALSPTVGYVVAVATLCLSGALFALWHRRTMKQAH